MKIQRDLEKTFSDLGLKRPAQREYIPAVLGISFGGSQYVDVPDREGYVYARIRNNLSEVVQVYNDAVVPAYNLQVLITRDDVVKSRYKVVAKDFGAYPDGWSTTNPYYATHASSHSFNPDNPGGDIVWVYPQQFLPLLAYPGTTGVVNIHPYTYNYNDNWYYVGGTGTSSVVPYNPTGTTTNSVVLVYNDLDGNPKLLRGDEFSSSYTGTVQIVPYIPNLPNDCLFPIAAVRLATGTSTVVWANLYDVRPFFGGSSNSSTFSTGSFMNPMTATGDMIYSNYNSITGSLTNLATWVSGTIATASSEYLSWQGPWYASTYVLEYSSDNDIWRNNLWSSENAAGGDLFVGCWIKIDLGASKTVGSFGMNQYTNSDLQASKYKVETSSDDINWTAQFDPHVAADGAYELVNFSAPVTARYFKFTGVESRYTGDSAVARWAIYDIKLYNQASNSSGQEPQRLPIGDEEQVLTVYGGLPTWRTPAWVYGTVLVYDDNTFSTSGTALHFNNNLSVITSGSSAWINGQASIPTYPSVYDDATYKTTGTSFIFIEDLAVLVTGTSAYIGVSSGTFSRDGHTHPQYSTGSSTTSGKYRQFTYIVTGSTFSFIIDEIGNPIMALYPLE